MSHERSFNHMKLRKSIRQTRTPMGRRLFAVWLCDIRIYSVRIMVEAGVHHSAYLTCALRCILVTLPARMQTRGPHDAGSC